MRILNLKNYYTAIEHKMKNLYSQNFPEQYIRFVEACASKSNFPQHGSHFFPRKTQRKTEFISAKAQLTVFVSAGTHLIAIRRTVVPVFSIYISVCKYVEQYTYCKRAGFNLISCAGFLSDGKQCKNMHNGREIRALYDHAEKS